MNWKKTERAKSKWSDEYNMKRQLGNFVPNNIYEISNDNCLKLVLHVKAEEFIKQMNSVIDWEIEMVLQNKLDPILANVQHTLKHPVIKQRRQFDKLIRNERAKRALKRENDVIKFIKCIKEKHYKSPTDHDSINSVAARPWKPDFGNSFIYDFYKNGKSFKTKMRQYDKLLGLHLPRSKRQVETVNSHIEMLAHMKINSREDNDRFYEMADNLINTKLF